MRSALRDRLERHVRVLAGTIGERNFFHPEALSRAALYIDEEWTGAGFKVRRETYRVQGREMDNLIVETGQTRGRPFILVGAHYDSAPGTPGADDNASGVAALIELGRALKESGTTEPVRLVAFASEEPPHFGTGEMGSAVHAERARAAGERIEGMLSLEMLGYYDETPGSQSYPPLLRFFYPETGTFLGLVGDLRSRSFLNRLAGRLMSESDIALEKATLPRWMPGVSLSDHQSFWRRGYPAAMLTDTAMYRNPHYHQATDLPETLDYVRLAAITEALAKVIGAWSREPEQVSS